jgi:hypothetical protein
MGAHVELHLLSKIIDDGELKDVLDEGITVDMFGQPEARLGPGGQEVPHGSIPGAIKPIVS